MVTYETIVAGVDFDELEPVATCAAAEMANALGSRTIHLVHVAQAPFWPADAVLWTNLDVMDVTLSVAREHLRRIVVPNTEALIARDARVGMPADQLISAARDVRADLMIVASRRRGLLGRVVLGSVASTLLRSSPCPVLVVGEDRRITHPPRNILAAVDDSPISRRVIEHAEGIARLTGGRVRTMSVWTGEPKDIIVGVAARSGAELVVIGTSGHNAWKRMLLGSTATHVVAEAHCPILAVPYDTKLDAPSMRDGASWVDGSTKLEERR